MYKYLIIFYMIYLIMFADEAQSIQESVDRVDSGISFMNFKVRPAVYNRRTLHKTHGASVNSVYDLNQDGYLDIVFSNFHDCTTGNINSFIYWGTKEYNYKRRKSTPTLSSIGNAVGDINSDGYPDLIVGNYSDGKKYMTDSYIYWGGRYKPYTRKSRLITQGSTGVTVADLNKDGYPDIIFCNYTDGKSYNVNSYIYWGSRNNSFEKTEIPTVGATQCTVADLNNDTYPDIVFSNHYNGKSYNINSYIYWGNGTKDFSRKSELPTCGAMHTSCADLNSDGYPDIIASNFYDGKTHNLKSYIFWNDPKFSFKRMTYLTTYGSTCNNVEDLNGDGYPDIIFSNQYNDISYNINSFIYWGDPQCSYFTRTDLPTRGAAGNNARDLDADGFKEIIFSNHLNGATYNINSYIYWGHPADMISLNAELAVYESGFPEEDEHSHHGGNNIGLEVYYGDSDMAILWSSDGGDPYSPEVASIDNPQGTGGGKKVPDYPYVFNPDKKLEPDDDPHIDDPGDSPNGETVVPENPTFLLLFISFLFTIYYKKKLLF